MKIILAHNEYQQRGGEEIVFEQEKKILERGGHDVVVYHRSNHEIGKLTTLERLTIAKRTVWATDTRRDFAQLLRQENPDLVHVHNTFMMISPSIYSACQDQNVPVVQTLHNFRLLCPAATFFRDGRVCEDCVEQDLWQSIIHGCYRGSRLATASVVLMLAWHRRLRTWTEMVNCYIALSEFARDKFVATGIPAEKIVVKSNFVDPDPGPREECCGEYALFAGRLSQEKGLDTLLRAWEQMPNHCELKIAGDGPERRDLEAQVRSRGISTITFCGYLPRQELIAAVKGARFLILPSECYENFPMSIAESFACGTPVVCSRLGAMQEIVTDSRTGIHFTPGSAEDLADKVRWAWSNPKRMAEMGGQARLQFESKYTAAMNYELLMQIYQRAMAQVHV
jgi:glycosyltransferase involved in cell wall biosynthesis